MFAIDSALQHTCAEFCEQAASGQLTAAERDLLIDGAILLAVHLEDLIQDARAGTRPAWLEASAGPRAEPRLSAA